MKTEGASRKLVEWYFYLFQCPFCEYEFILGKNKPPSLSGINKLVHDKWLSDVVETSKQISTFATALQDCINSIRFEKSSKPRTQYLNALKEDLVAVFGQAPTDHLLAGLQQENQVFDASLDCLLQSLNKLVADMTKIISLLVTLHITCANLSAHQSRVEVLQVTKDNILGSLMLHLNDLIKERAKEN